MKKPTKTQSSKSKALSRKPGKKTPIKKRSVMETTMGENATMNGEQNGEQKIHPSDDLQGNILTGYSDASRAIYLFYRVDLPELARPWLARLIPHVTTEPEAGEADPPWVNVAVTFQGLKALGVSPTLLDKCPLEFRDGMKKRAETLRDFGDSAPANWEEPLGALQVHVAVLIQAPDGKQFDAAIKEKISMVNDGAVPSEFNPGAIKEQARPSLGITLLWVQYAKGLPDLKEHFGFRDGISQPWIEGMKSDEPGRNPSEDQKHGGKRIVKDGRRDWAPLKLGEFILGYEDELGRIPSPRLPDGRPEPLWHNGTYMVLRKLHQDVVGFNNTLKAVASQVFKGVTEENEKEMGQRLGALMVGRWPSGCPVALSPENDNADLPLNEFDYDTDPVGRICPVGAHIRRTNPRDLSVKDIQGPHGKELELVVEPVSTRHRMIRRGLPYGEMIKGEIDDGQDRGMMFVALVADIGRQFEFVQQNWVSDGDPFRLDATDRDPLIGNNRDERDVPSQALYRAQSEILVKVLKEEPTKITGTVTQVIPRPKKVEYVYKPAPGTDLDLLVRQNERLAKALKVDRVTIFPADDKQSVRVIVDTFKETKRQFTVPSATKIPWALNLPEFVTTRGGEYFFLPSKRALEGLSGLAEDLGFSSFMKEYKFLEAMVTDPAKRPIAQTKLISNWLINRPKEMLDELLRRASDPKEPIIFQMPGYAVFGDPRYSIPPIAVLTKYKDVKEVLDGENRPQFTVKLYRDKMEVDPPRPPRGPFILGMELKDPRYTPEMKILGQAVGSLFGKLPQILEKILDPIFAAIGARDNTVLDVVQDIAWPVPLGINAEYCGVPGPDPDKFKRWLRDIYKDLFLNLRQDQEWSKAADQAVSEMNPYLDGLIQRAAQQLQVDQASVQDSVLKELIKAKLPPGLPDFFIRRNMMGLTVGVVETTLKAIARTIDQLIRRPKELKEAQDAANRGDQKKVLQYALEAMRFNPQNHVLFRVCARDTTIAAGTPRKAVIKKGTLVFTSTLSAMFDSDAREELRGNPNRFDPARHHISDSREGGSSPFLFFGYDGHECMGRYLVPIVLQEVLMRVLKLKNLRRANDDPFDPVDVLPEHLLLEFDR